MDLCVMPRLMNRVVYDAMRDFDRFETSIFPYWREADHSVLHVANETQQFRPEELNVHLEGRELTIEGKREHKSENGAILRSFTRKWLLPENVDLQAVRTQLDEKGHLSVEAPKNAEGQEKKRTIPIMAASRKD
ncbi:Hsp20/alpha crystallin family protein [Teladorsagia circumcincta]|uniref:Hsp20/alpha crystallin family protein n=1 Tax=Teladorsagia circumcincta TaxID=45464 RepID=A0A2G9UJB3_TELCI|nr:Hsp20/alpha crystallin family protein [Teladorsagia circumcincta]